MRKLILLLAVAVMTAVAACSDSTPGYSPEKCDALRDKIQNAEPFDQKDYATLIGQVDAMSEIVRQKAKEVGDDPTKAAETGADAEFMKLATTAFGFAYYLEQHRADLDEENEAKWADVTRRLNEENP